MSETGESAQRLAESGGAVLGGRAGGGGGTESRRIRSVTAFILHSGTRHRQHRRDKVEGS